MSMYRWFPNPRQSPDERGLNAAAALHKTKLFQRYWSSVKGGKIVLDAFLAGMPGNLGNWRCPLCQEEIGVGFTTLHGYFVHEKCYPAHLRKSAARVKS